MEFDLDQVVEKMIDTPPRCISGFTAVRADSPEPWDFCNLATWQLACPCGSKTGEFLGYPLRDYATGYDGTAFVGPLRFLCRECNATAQILNTKEHGYHAEIGSGSAHICGEGEPVAFGCESCHATMFLVFTTFFYWGAATDLVEDEPDEFTEKAQDIFNEFVAYGKCSECGKMNRFTDFGKL